jgi:hypothetical protein
MLVLARSSSKAANKTQREAVIRLLKDTGSIWLRISTALAISNEQARAKCLRALSELGSGPGLLRDTLAFR